MESIGDAMSLFDQGIKNVLVIFGLSVSASIISYLSGKEINNIIDLAIDLKKQQKKGKENLRNFLKQF